jgi:hypothetical protein
VTKCHPFSGGAQLISIYRFTDIALEEWMWSEGKEPGLNMTYLLGLSANLAGFVVDTERLELLIECTQDEITEFFDERVRLGYLEQVPINKSITTNQFFQDIKKGGI